MLVRLEHQVPLAQLDRKEKRVMWVIKEIKVIKEPL
jgi:hypothetical protein